MTTAGRGARTNYEYARQWLRGEILAGKLEPGTRLRQNDLAARLEMSTTPVREALQDLAREGLVTHDPHRGTVVRPMTIETVREIYEIRMLLEPLLIRRAWRQLEPETIARADALHAEMKTEKDVSRWAELNREFHSLLALPCVDTELGGITRQLRDRATPWVAMSLGSPTQRKTSNAEHKRMVALIRAGKEAELAALTKTHLAATLAILEEQLGDSETVATRG